MATLSFEEKLQRYADLTVKVGLNLQPGQRLHIIASPLEVAPVVRAVTASAYQNGSRLVTATWIDEQLDIVRYQHAPRDSFEEFKLLTSIPTDIAQGLEQGDAILYIVGSDPELLKDQDSELVATATRIFNKHLKPISNLTRKNVTQWLGVCPPTPGWATKVFPDKSPQDAVEQLWDAVFKTSRVDEPNPIAVWEQQAAELRKRREYLTEKQYLGLKYTAPGTDLTIGLPEGHIWFGGAAQTPSGVSFIPNLPTEEVFTLPHKDKTQGTVTATKPLSYLGNLIENFNLTFTDGKVTSFSAQKGEEALRGLLEMDENAKQLGEVALIPHKTPISQLGLVFLNVLYDENASNHLALGNAYRFTLKGGTEMTDEEFVQAGGNNSLVHVDFMFGSGEMDVDGLKADGSTEPVMRQGEWAFDV